MKKLSFALLILLVAVVMAGCTKAKAPGYDVVANGVKPTGNVIDITDLNGQATSTTPGDVVYVKLVGLPNDGKQWNFSSPTSGQPLMLTDHQVTGRGDKTATEVVDQWWLKVEQTGTIHLQFDYGKSNKKADKSFKFDIISQ